ncbi:MAG: hypothetical protein H0W89_01630 [Candidatus Levybacteria bacterium]|nr:hypothetical protein [Candidatus Levybacteria bacterium]
MDVCLGTLRAQMPFHEDYAEWFSQLEKIESLEVQGGLYVSEKMHAEMLYKYANIHTSKSCSLR